ncbi:hypothetical protein [Nostoc sp.]|uniref:hypothetical protein n=1 Tax=Nostoc sp. TaxID=1180 RepID=UPI002FF9B7D6
MNLQFLYSASHSDAVQHYIAHYLDFSQVRNPGLVSVNANRIFLPLVKHVT